MKPKANVIFISHPMQLDAFLVQNAFEVFENLSMREFKLAINAADV